MVQWKVVEIFLKTPIIPYYVVSGLMRYEYQRNYEDLASVVRRIRKINSAAGERTFISENLSSRVRVGLMVSRRLLLRT